MIYVCDIIKLILKTGRISAQAIGFTQRVQVSSSLKRETDNSRKISVLAGAGYNLWRMRYRSDDNWS
jgi:hypothetical protein